MVDGRKHARKKSASSGGRPASRPRAVASPARRGTLRLALVLGVLVVVNLYVFLWRRGTSLPDVQKAAINAGKPAEPTPSTAPSTPGPAPGGAAPGVPENKVLEGEVEKGESLGRILRRAGLEPPAADEVIRAVADICDFRSIRAGQTWRVELAPDGRVASFELVISKIMTVRARRDAGGKLVGVKDEAATRIELDEVGGRIDSSLYASVKAAGEDSALVSFFVDVFAYDLDFYTETYPGDTFRVLVEKELKGDEFLRYKRIVAAEYSGKAGTYRAFWFQPPGSKKGAYFDQDGRSVEKSMLKTPLKFAKVSSAFNPKRMHPILHRVKGHFGVDYAAPVGTPVWAAASGRIVSRGPAGGAGNMIVLSHDGGLTTLYMHLSRFQGGQRVGQFVDAKTVIGYVGTTGLSTGPHLHFGVKQNGSYVDPLRLAPQRKGGVAKKDMVAYKAETRGLVDRMAHIKISDAAAAVAIDGAGGAAAPLARPVN